MKVFACLQVHRGAPYCAGLSTESGLAWLPCRACQGADEAAAELHDWLAAYLWAGLGSAALAAASAHWAHGRASEGFAASLVEAARQGSPCEEDLFLARAALQARAHLPPGLI